MITKIKSKLIMLSLKLRNTFKRISNNSKMIINIASSSTYKGKVKEDLNLEYYLLKNKVKTKIEDWNKYDPINPVVVRSVWGYQNNIKDFKVFLSQKELITVNPKEILLNNMDKEEQLNIFNKYKLPHIKTDIIHNISDLDKIKIDKKTVLKPVISASGNNTFLISNKDELSLSIKAFKEKNINDILVQPYIEEIKNGELSVIVIDNEIMYGIKRFPGIFTKTKKIEYITKEELDNKVNQLIKSINDIKEYQEKTYYRIDLVLTNNEYQIIEIELLDPSLFIETIPNKEYRNIVYDKLTKSIINSVKKQTSK